MIMAMMSLFRLLLAAATLGSSIVRALSSAPGPPALASLSVRGKDSIEVSIDPPISDGGSPITAYTIEWDKEAGIPEVQRISTSLNLGANEIQSLSTFVDDINEVQVLRTSATARGEVQTITVSPPPGEAVVESAYTFAIQLDTTSSGGSLQYSGQISATAAADGSRISVQEILGSMSNIPEMPTVVKSPPNADGGHTYTVTFPTSLRNIPQMQVFVSDVPVSIETVEDANVLGGSFRLEYHGEMTEDIAVDASPGVLQSALEALSTIATVGVSRSEGDDQGGYSWGIEFTSNDNGGNLPDLIPHGHGLTTTNGAAGGALVEIVPGGGRHGSYIDGTFTIGFGGETTVPLPSDADASVLKEALESLSTIEKVDVERSNIDSVGGCTWTIGFLEDDERIHRGDMPPLVVQSHLNGGGSSATPTIRVEEVRKGTLMEVQTIEVTAGGAHVDPTSTFRLSFRGEETNDIFALPAGGSTCLGSTAARQIITTSTEDTTGEGGDDTVSHLTTFTLTYEDYTTSKINANLGSCEESASKIATELEKIPPLYSVSVSGSDTESGDEGCAWTVTFESVVGNPELLDVTAYHGELSAGPGTTVTVGPGHSSIVRDTIAVSQPPEFQGDVDLIQSELSKLSTVGLVTVTADDIVPDEAGQCRWYITFESNAGDLPSLQVAPSGSADFAASAVLNSGDIVVVVDNVIQGTSVPMSGDFTLSYDGEVTGYLSHDVSADAMKYALEGLDSIGEIDVQRYGPDVNDCYTWDVTFLSDLGPHDVMIADGLDLLGTVASVSAATHIAGVTPPFNGPDYGSHVLMGGTGRDGEYVGFDENPSSLALATVISPLKQGVPYYFRVSAANALGSGPVTASTPPFEIPLPQPPSDPTHVALEVKDGSTLKVTVGEPERNGGESIESYLVEYSTSEFLHEKQRVSLTCSPQAEVQTVTISAADVNEIQYLVIDSSHKGSGAVPETQRITCDATGGNFGLSFGENSDIAYFSYDDDAGAIKQSFESLDIVDSVSVAVDTPNGAACAPYDGMSAGSFTVTFHSLVAISGDIPLLVPQTASLEGARRIDVATVTDGDAPVGGTFRMSFRGALSDPVDASLAPVDLAAAIQSALENIDTIENEGIVVSHYELSNGGEEKIMAIEFVGSGVGGDVVAIDIPKEHNLVHGSFADVYVITDGDSYIARNENDVVTSRVGNVLSGSFRLRLRGHVTEDIPFNASDDDIKAKLEALPNVGTVDVQVIAGPTNQRGYTWSITFGMNPGYFPPNTRNVDTLQYVSSLTTSVDVDSSATISIETIREGDEQLHGTFQLSYNDGIMDESTLALNSFVSASQMKEALESLPNIGRVAVTRSQSRVGYEWDIEFVACELKGGKDVCNDGNLLPLVATDIDLAGCGVASLEVTELQAGSGAGACPHFVSGRCSELQSVATDQAGNDILYPVEHDIHGLNLGVPYFVQVRYSNSQSYGYRRLSTPLSVSPHHNPPGAPPPVVLKQSTATSLTLMWEPPTENGGKRVSGYELWMDEWSGGNPFMIYDGSDDPNTLEYTLTAGNVGPLSQVVDPGRQYRFQVRAINNCNTTDADLSCHGLFSDIQVFTVRDPRRPLPPSAPDRDARTVVTGPTTASISVTWSRPVDNGGSPINGYILYMKHPDDTMESFALGPHASSWTVENLSAGEAYRFHVVAVNSIGRSGNSPVLTIVAAMPPGIDGSLTETYSDESYRPIIADVKETEMVIQWSAPAHSSSGGSPVTGYKLYQYEGVDPNTKSNPEPIKQEVQDILIMGGSGGIVTSGTFTISFRGKETVSIPVDASAEDVKFALQNLDTIYLVSVESIAPTDAESHSDDGSFGWRVGFISEAGDLPLMQTTSGRLVGAESARVVVKEHIKGDKAILIYVGTDEPSVRSYTASNLFPDARYAFKVAPMNAVGDGVLSLATTTTIARAGASAQQTTASGGALVAGIAGSIQEEQIIVFSSDDCDSDRLVLSFGDSEQQTPNLCGSSAEDFKTAIEGLQGIGDIHVTRKDIATLAGSPGHAWSVTFLSSKGDVSSLIVDVSQVNNGKDPSDRSGLDATYVKEFLRGRANEFTIEPKKASGAVVRDVTASDGMAGQEEFFTELWTSDTSVLDGSHDWYSDGEVASYNPVRYEEQMISIPNGYTGTFQLMMDTSIGVPNGRLGGYFATTPDMYGDDLTDIKVQTALSNLGNIGEVLVSSTTNEDEDTLYTVKFVTVLGELPLLAASDPAIVITRDPRQIGVAEIQTITSSVDQAFTYEVQRIAVPSSASLFTLAFGGNPSTNPISCDFASIDEAKSIVATIKSELEATSNVLDVIVSIDDTGDGSDDNPWTFQITFVEPVGPLPLVQSDNAIVSQVVQGHSAMGGSLVLSYEGAYTDDIAFDASADTIKHQLEMLSTIDEVDVRKINKRTGYQWEVVFTKSIGNLPSIVTHTQIFGAQRIETIGGHPTPLGGSFKLVYQDEQTELLPFDASKESVKSALEALPSIGLVDVDRVIKANGQFEWIVTFRVPYVPAKLKIDWDGLTGTLDDAVVTAIVEAVPKSLVSSSGAAAKVLVEEKVAGLPSYTARYTADRVGSYSLAVLKLESGGLMGRYYDNQWLLDEPVMERVDQGISFDWGSGTITPYGRDFVSVRWWGKVRPKTNEHYTFYLVADDGVRLFVDHELLIDAWEGVEPGNEQRGSVMLKKDSFHDIRVEYREEIGSAAISLQWSSSSIRKEVIPSLHLYQPLHIHGSPFTTTVKPGSSSYPHSTVVDWKEETLTGKVTNFVIQSRDSKGNNKITSGDAQGDVQSPEEQFSVDILDLEGNESASADVEYIGSGQYRVSYLVKKSGSYRVHVRTAGTDIYCGLGEENKCSPFDLTVLSGPTVAATSIARSSHPPSIDDDDDDDSILVEIQAGETGVINIEARDAYGNRREKGSDDFVVLFTSQDNNDIQYRATVSDQSNDNGSYRATYSIPLAGDYQVSILLEELPVPAFKILSVMPNDHLHALSTTVVDASDAAAGSDDVLTRGLSSAIVGIETGFVIESRDSFGNLRESSQDHFIATLTGPDDYEVVSSSSVLVLQCADSSVQGKFRLEFDGTMTPDLPHDISAASMQTVLSNTSSGEVKREVVIVRTEAENGAYIWTITVLNPPGPLLIVHPDSSGDTSVSDILTIHLQSLSPGRYAVRYTLWKTGTYQLTVTTMEGELVSGSDYTIGCTSGDVQAPSSYAEGDGLEKGTAGEQATFRIQARDVHQKQVHVVEVEINDEMDAEVALQSLEGLLIMQKDIVGSDRVFFVVEES